jgi:hypothetical protein
MATRRDWRRAELGAAVVVSAPAELGTDVAVALAELAAVCGVIGAGTELAAAGAAVAQASG